MDRGRVSIEAKLLKDMNERNPHGPGSPMMRQVLRGSRAARRGAAPTPRGLQRLRVAPAPGRKSRAVLLGGTLVLPCVIGPAGLTRRKREGDGATPMGRFALLGCFFRADREPRPAARLPLRATRRHDGWCDDPGHACYNRPVQLPFGARHEAMWRKDRLYDLGIVVDYNQTRPRKRLGSAIFIHVMAPGQTPTAGCVALHPADLRRLLPRLAPGCRLSIG